MKKVMSIKKNGTYLCYNNTKEEWQFKDNFAYAYCFDSIEELEKIAKELNIVDYEIIF